MATEAQIIANRRNAQKSTGPRSTKGKAIASKNSLKHGILAKKTVISSENQQEFNLFRDRILEELSPQSPMESVLVQRVVDLSWQLKRIKKIQKQTIDILSTPKPPSPLNKFAQSLLPKGFERSPDPPEFSPQLALGRLAIEDFSNERVLERLLMYERRIENSLYKTLLEIQRLNLLKQINPEHQLSFQMKKLTG